MNQQLKIRIEDPQWVEIPNAKNAKDYIDGIKSDINPAICKMIVVILFMEIKPQIKNFLDTQGGIPSQFVRTGKLRNASLSVMLNILKQMNAKLKCDLYRLSLPSFKHTMIVGFDVVSNGREKLIGCSATYTPDLTQCASKIYRQKVPSVPE